MKTPEAKAKELIIINSLIILSIFGNKLTMDEVEELAKEFTLSKIDKMLDDRLNPRLPYNYFKQVRQEIEKNF
jgi:hypothetical protein